ncbi:MAG TPA: S8 family serine peptidase, partial [Candidatus Polarisedimenticolia bacterium]|nr:S8 family serine peptidase [Candidatus Polarisedimenticolia bacterium]
FDEAAAVGGVPEFAALAGIHPESYLVNAGVHGVATLHAAGILGQGVVVAVLDSGIKRGFPHLTSDGSVIGGMDFVGDGLPYDTFLNNGHGTFVAGMISANLTPTFPGTSPFLRAVKRHAPDAVVNSTGVPMIGSAPLSSLFIMRVFGVLGQSPTSVVLDALDEAIVLREAYDHGVFGGVNIKVVNMSLSGATLAAGREIVELAADELLAADIVVVDSAGNAGPSSMTIGSPGSSLESLNVGAMSLALNERIEHETFQGIPAADVYRPSAAPQIAYFSSRGPLADGRVDPDVVASGVSCYGMGFAGTGSISIASGTSFSTPIVAGVAALLRQAHPAATARQIRDAIRMSANPDYIPGVGRNDQGLGVVDAQAASDLLAAGAVPDLPAEAPHAVKSVAANLAHAGIGVSVGTVNRPLGRLIPGQRTEVFYQTGPNIARITIELANIVPELPVALQNQYFGDQAVLVVHSVKTTKFDGPLGGDGDYLLGVFTLDGSYTVEVPEPGILRVTVLSSWTNAGAITGDLKITPQWAATPRMTAQGTIVHGQELLYSFTMPEGLGKADFRLSWTEGWSSYPANDLDFYLIDANGFVYPQGAQLNMPEHVTYYQPPPGQWGILLQGFEVNTPDDRYKLRIAFDDKVQR